MLSPPSLVKLIRALSALPGIGNKTAERLAFYIIHSQDDFVRELTAALIEVKAKVHLCNHCFNITEQTTCSICLNPNRNQKLLCIVERPTDVRVIEESATYHGLYYVLHGTLSVLDGTAPDNLKIKALAERIKQQSISEVILAMNHNVEGDATAHYLKSRLIAMNPVAPYCKISRLAAGIPIGGELIYADQATLSQALAGRQELR